MEYMKAVNYTGFNYFGTSEEQAKESLRIMKQDTGCNMIILVVTAYWDSKESEPIQYQYEGMPDDRDIIDFLRYAKETGLKTAVKPVIYFIQEDGKENLVWSDYVSFLLHYIRLAERCRCDLFFIGSQLESSMLKQTDLWEKLITQIRKHYHGMLTYESLHGMEDCVEFWNKLDFLCSDGCYPEPLLHSGLEHLERLSEKYRKPAFLSECGCRSIEGAAGMPQTWKMSGKLNLSEQEFFFRSLFQEIGKSSFLTGIGIWNWANRLIKKASAEQDTSCSIYGKPACKVIRNFFCKERT